MQTACIGLFKQKNNDVGAIGIGANEILMLGYVYIVAKGKAARNLATEGRAE